LRVYAEEKGGMDKLKFCVLLFMVTFSGRVLASPGIQELSPAQIFQYNADAVFTIYASINNSSFNPVGSGFFLCSTGIAVTNHHVIASWPYAFIRTHNGQRFNISGYYSYDLSNDLAIIQVEGRDFPYLARGDSDSLRIGDTVYAIGSPLGHHNTFSAGMISRFVEVSVFNIYRVYGMIQVTVPISPGSSGGALLNDSGQVIGITTAQTVGARAQALNFAVPIARVDLTGTEGAQYLSLPIGETPSDSDLIGTWHWARGEYVFNANGTGSRVWDEIPNSFQWHIAGFMLVLDIHGGSEEQWPINVINENDITIGGASFSRAADPSPGQGPQRLLGSWVWDNGDVVLTFFGTRFHSTSSYWGDGTFTVSGSRLALNRSDGGVRHYDISFRDDDNTLLIGSWTYYRRQDTGFSVELLRGSWVWDSGDVVLTFSESRFYSNFHWGEGTFTVSDSRLTLNRTGGGIRHYDISFRNNNTLLIGNWTYHRRR